jgi:hypothetical protein
MKTKRVIAWICGVPLGLFLLLFLLAIAASPTPLGAVLLYLPLGWWHFLQRNLQQMTCNWNLIATGAICSALVIIFGNWLLSALFAQFYRSKHPGQPTRRWRWRWTIGIYLAVWLLFGIAMGSTGVFRHTTWLMDYDQPWFEERINSYSEFRMTDSLIQELLLENEQDLDATRKAFLRQRSYRGRQTLICDEFNVLFYANKSNKIEAYIVVPRNPRMVAKGQFAVSTLETNESFRPLSELQSTIADLDATYSRNK